DGRVEIAGFDGRFKGVMIERPGFDTQMLSFTEQASSPLVATLPQTRPLEGRFIFPKGVEIDPSRAIVLFTDATETTIPCKNRSKDFADSPTFAFWQQSLPKIDHEGRFRISGVPEHGRARLRVKGFPDIPLMYAPAAPSKEAKPVPQTGIIKFEIPLTVG